MGWIRRCGRCRAERQIASVAVARGAGKVGKPGRLIHVHRDHLHFCGACPRRAGSAAGRGDLHSPASRLGRRRDGGPAAGGDRGPRLVSHAGRARAPTLWSTRRGRDGGTGTQGLGGRGRVRTRVRCLQGHIACHCHALDAPAPRSPGRPRPLCRRPVPTAGPPGRRGRGRLLRPDRSGRAGRTERPRRGPPAPGPLQQHRHARRRPPDVVDVRRLQHRHG